jgi:hypothetical protein
MLEFASMAEPSAKQKTALERAQEEGVDLTQLYERLSWTPTERIRRNYEGAILVEELKKAGQRHRDAKRG